ncbi:MAG: glycine betaine ABC transporter substrate-binding protein [bacterium]|jgi:osmoprotectant transport system permease protein
MKLITVFTILLFLTQSTVSREITIGSKKFTESVILGEMARQMVESTEHTSYHRRELGGSRFLWSALLAGDIDIYPEYTGTLIHEILHAEQITSIQNLREVLSQLGVRMSKPIGFNNTYALGMQEQLARQLKIQTISDLRNHPDLRFGFNNEFLDRNDGWHSVRRRYNLPQQNVQGLDHDLAYRGIAEGAIDLIDLYSTDAEIEYYNLRALEDDLKHFPEYQAVYLVREELLESAPEAVKQVLLLEGDISEEEMIEMNAQAKIHHVPEAEVAATFLKTRYGLETEINVVTPVRRILNHLYEHLYLVVLSMTAAILISIPLGILAAKYTAFSASILGIVGIIQTIPALALLVFMIPFFGIGAQPAIVALFLYSLLPIVRNTYAGLQNIPASMRESAQALGLPSKTILWKIELPLAARSILAGIKTSVVINIGTATLGALIGARGLGQPILTGIRLDNLSLILQGAIPAALLAICAQLVFDAIEKWIIPRGLRENN